QSDGKVLVCGTFAHFNQAPHSGLARLNSDGSLDSSFAPNISGSAYKILVQSDGKIVIAGSIGALAGRRVQCVLRLNSDGSLDPDFSPEGFYSSANAAWVDQIVLQADGKFVVAGDFSIVGSFSRYQIARLNSDGSVDPSFVHAGYPRISSMLL